MAGFLLQAGATVTCSHGGQAVATSPNPSVAIEGQPTALISGQWAIAGCPLVPPPLSPCVTAQWVTGTTRVTSNGQPLVVQSGAAVCVPNGTPLIPIATQSRVTAV